MKINRDRAVRAVKRHGGRLLASWFITAVGVGITLIIFMLGGVATNPPGFSLLEAIGGYLLIGAVLGLLPSLAHTVGMAAADRHQSERRGGA